MALAEYKRKRNFKRTPEPTGQRLTKDSFRYVIQKHAASHLHYDFRLELNGVLKSWAVPKGPSLDPSIKRLAMHVEDHPVEYGEFEGIIPEGEYGGGTVMLWDRGQWEPLEDPGKGYRSGHLHFKLHGEKLRGGWYLVRSGTSDETRRNWLLFKAKDKYAKRRGDILKQQPLSVVSQRNLDEIANDKDRVWHSNSKATGGPSLARASKPAKRTVVENRPAQRRAALRPQDLPSARKAAFPRQVQTQLATLTKEPPVGNEWFHEMKFDGYRMLCKINGASVDLVSRNEKSWTKRLEFLAHAAPRLKVKQAILDGEVVALEPGGVSSFQALQNVFSENRTQELVYYLFDILYLDGYDLRPCALEDRKKLLARLVGAGIGPFRLSEHIEGNGPAFFKQACQARLEGIISKRRDRPYSGGRSYDWAKIKCVQKEEFVVGGYTDPAGSRTSFGALLVGYHDHEGKLHYAGKVGTGFNNRVLIQLLKRLEPLARKDSPFVDLVRKVGVARNAHWVKPQLVAQVEFTEWTRDGRLRHPSFQGLREDKRASEVVRDVALPVAAVVEASKHAKPRAR